MEGGAEGRGGEDGGEGGREGARDTARSAAALGQSTRTRGSGDSGATHPLLQHPPSQETTKPWALGVSHSAHTAATVKPMREIRNRKDYREIRDKRCTSLSVPCHTARVHMHLYTHACSDSSTSHIPCYFHPNTCTDTLCPATWPVCLS